MLRRHIFEAVPDIHPKIILLEAACAAAYVGLSVFEPGEPKRWDN
jgi:hypothetical protein